MRLFCVNNTVLGVGELNSLTPKILLFTGKIFSIFTQTEISVILADFYLNLVVMAKPFKFYNPKTVFIRKNCHRITCIFCFFCLNLVAMVTPLAPLKF